MEEAVLVGGPVVRDPVGAFVVTALTDAAFVTLRCGSPPTV